MAQVITFANRKGGCAKSTSAICFAQELRRRGYKTLLIDCDGQANASMFYGAKSGEGVPSTTTLLTHNVSAKEYIQHLEYGDIIPADNEIFDADVMVKPDEMRFFHIKYALQDIENEYDFIICDTPPGVGVVLRNCLATSTHIIIPVDESGWSVDALIEFYDVIKMSRMLNPTLQIAGVLITNSDYNNRNKRSYRIKEQASKIAEAIGSKSFDTRIRHTTKLAEAITEFRVPIFDYVPSGTASIDYEFAVNELLETIGMPRNPEDK